VRLLLPVLMLLLLLLLLLLTMLQSCIAHVIVSVMHPTFHNNQNAGSDNTDTCLMILPPW